MKVPTWEYWEGIVREMTIAAQTPLHTAIRMRRICVVAP
jgi:hypothetical protein